MSKEASLSPTCIEAAFRQVLLHHQQRKRIRVHLGTHLVLFEQREERQVGVNGTSGLPCLVQDCPARGYAYPLKPEGPRVSRSQRGARALPSFQFPQFCETDSPGASQVCMAGAWRLLHLYRPPCAAGPSLRCAPCTASCRELRHCWPSRHDRLRCKARHSTADGRDAGQDMALAELLSEAEEEAELLPLEADGTPVWLGIVPTVDEVCEDRDWPAHVRDWRRFWGAVRNWRICLTMDVLDMDLFPTDAELEWLRLLDDKGNLRESRIAQARPHHLAGFRSAGLYLLSLPGRSASDCLGARCQALREVEARRDELAALGAEPPDGPIAVPHGPPGAQLPTSEELLEEVKQDLAMPSMRALTPDVLGWYFDHVAQSAGGDADEGAAAAAAAAADPVMSAAATASARPGRAAVDLEADFEEDEGEEDEGEGEGEDGAEGADEEADAERMAAIASASPEVVERAWREFTAHVAALLAEGEAAAVAEEHRVREEELPMNRLRDELMAAGEDVLAATDEAAAEALKAQIKGGKRVNTLPAELDEAEDEGYSVPPPAPERAPIVAPWESWDEWDWRAWLEKRRVRERQYAEYQYKQARRTCTLPCGQGLARLLGMPVTPAGRCVAEQCLLF